MSASSLHLSLSSPDIGPRERAMVEQVLSTSTLSIGPMLDRFESGVAQFVGRRFAVGVSSGTAGLHLAVIEAGLGPGDEVITTSFSFVASANCLLYVGARPVFVDIDPDTFDLNPTLVEAAITPRTKAILPVHVFGQPCQMDEILELADRYGLVVIEDACEAFGSQYKNRRVGTFGRSAVFAFYPNKQVTTGEGGVLVTDDEAAVCLFRSLRNQGRGDGGAYLNHVRLGYNYRLPELSAALGLAQLERVDELLSRRAQVAAWYTSRLAHIEGVAAPHVSPETTCMSWFVCVVRLDQGISQIEVIKRLAARGIPTRPYFAPIHLQPLYRERFGYVGGELPVTEDIGRRTLALPFHGNLSEQDVEYVCDELARAVRGDG